MTAKPINLKENEVRGIKDGSNWSRFHFNGRVSKVVHSRDALLRNVVGGAA